MMVTVYRTGSKSVVVAVSAAVVVAVVEGVVVVSQTIRCSEIVGGSDLMQLTRCQAGDI